MHPKVAAVVGVGLWQLTSLLASRPVSQPACHYPLPPAPYKQFASAWNAVATRFGNLAMLRFLHDLLSTVGSLNLKFQSSTILAVDVQPAVAATISSLRAQYLGSNVRPGTMLQRFYDGLEISSGCVYHNGRAVLTAADDAAAAAALAVAQTALRAQ